MLLRKIHLSCKWSILHLSYLLFTLQLITASAGHIYLPFITTEVFQTLTNGWPRSLQRCVTFYICTLPIENTPISPSNVDQNVCSVCLGPCSPGSLDQLLTLTLLKVGCIMLYPAIQCRISVFSPAVGQCYIELYRGWRVQGSGSTVARVLLV